MKKIYLLLAITFLFTVQTKAQEAITNISAKGNVEETVKKLTTVLDSKGLKVFAVIDHKKGAQSVSMELLPTTLVIFGNPAAGTKLMNCDQTIGIDLPMKMLIYEDKEGKTWISYWKPSLLANKYNLETCQPILDKLDGAMAKFAAFAAE